MTPDLDRIEAAIGMILETIGEDPQREGLLGTPRRVARFWEEFINYDPGNIDVTFESVQVDQMVAVSGIRVYSLCEHHLLPFYCDLSIGYITTNRVIGLSKLARIAHKHAHKLQLQERLVDEIAGELVSLVSRDVAVIGKGLHMCMAMRGIKTPATMITSAMRGRFLTKPSVRAEFMQLVK
jgi:GTP cyclohydrolase I